jgi:hypothetical protein
MKHSDFVIGETFWWSQLPWRCTDIGTRVIMAFRLDTFSDGRSFGAPPNGLLEIVFDESAIKECAIHPILDEHGNPPKPRVGEIHSVVVEGADAERIRQNIANGRARGKGLVWAPPGLRHAEFEIGAVFGCGGFRFWRCTDTGTRTIAVTALDDFLIEGRDSEDERPHSSESVFDEYDIQDCDLVLQLDEDVLDWLRKKGIKGISGYYAKLEEVLRDAMRRDP